ncbi:MULTISPECIES: glycosyltransferase family 10 domain-containing protein [Helicobacter]|uniref:glycosyltransferase family 10 domain-containing protein n=1 Tax=Helicobacter TaxID=209 RepID=UPI0026265AB8|nr:glycosyltransferase family 10 [Helicobacter sp. UBA3407]
MKVKLKDTNFLEILTYQIVCYIQVGFVQILCSFIPSKQIRHKIRKALFPKEEPYLYLKTKKGSKYPLYIPSPHSFSPNPSAVYNAKGEKLYVFFIRSEHYCGGGAKIYWDMHNISLPIHFYQDDCCFETIGNPMKRYAWLVEPPCINQKINTAFQTQALHKDFDLVLTHSDKLLDTLPNARLLPFWSIWYGNEVRNNQKDNPRLDKNLYLFKEKDISMVCSNKLLTPLHHIRHHFAKRALQGGKVDVFGEFNNKLIMFKSQSLEHYRYQIVIENEISSFYFTEKVLDCFASMTIPIYLGATKIDKFFNTDGMIILKEDSDLDSILKTCCKEDYENRLEAIKDNYHRLFSYNIENSILEYIK